MQEQCRVHWCSQFQTLMQGKTIINQEISVFRYCNGTKVEVDTWMNHEKWNKMVNFCTMIIFLTYNSFKTWGDVLISCLDLCQGHAAAEIENTSGWHAGTPTICLKPSFWLNTQWAPRIFSLLVSLSLTFNILQLFFRENETYLKGKKMLTKCSTWLVA